MNCLNNSLGVYLRYAFIHHLRIIFLSTLNSQAVVYFLITYIYTFELCTSYSSQFKRDNVVLTCIQTSRRTLHVYVFHARLLSKFNIKTPGRQAFTNFYMYLTYITFSSHYTCSIKLLRFSLLTWLLVLKLLDY